MKELLFIAIFMIKVKVVNLILMVSGDKNIVKTTFSVEMIGKNFPKHFFFHTCAF